MAEENGKLLCQVCGNTARLTVIVRNPYVNGQYARNVCSRLCGEIKAREGAAELERTGGLVGKSTVEMVSVLTGKSPSVVMR